MITNPTVCVIGIGYVGLPLTYLLRQHGSTEVYAMDVNASRIEAASRGLDHTSMVPTYALDEYHDGITWVTEVPAGMDFYIVCVPTPDNDGVPDYSYVDAACKSVIEVAGKKSTLVLESTVGPGTCRRRIQDMLQPHDTLLVAYSPERINPSDTAYDDMRHSPKLVATDDPSDSRTDNLVSLYKRVFRGGVTFVEDTRVAELAKCFENFQRDMNIAMMNELSMQCFAHRVSFTDVVAALRTKPSSPIFHSGMVGGHCIPVDPYYLSQWYSHFDGTDSAGLPQASRIINEGFVGFVETMCRTVPVTRQRNVLVLGATYKPDVADTRNSGAMKVYHALDAAGIKCDLYDPVAGFTQLTPGLRYNVLLAAVNHKEFKRQSVSEYLPLTIDCKAINVGHFTRNQLAGVSQIIDI